MELSYQPIAPEDVENIFAFQKQLIEQYEDLSAIDTEKVFAWCLKKVKNTSQNYRKIIKDGQTVGYYALSKQESGEWELDDFYLFASARKQGIGTQVLQKIMTDTHPDPIFLYVFRKNTGAVRLYQRMGFEVSKTMDTRMILTLNRR